MRTRVPTFAAVSSASSFSGDFHQIQARVLAAVASHTETTPQVVRHGSLVTVATHDGLQSRGSHTWRLSDPPGTTTAATRHPPFAEAVVAPDTETAHATVDACGLRHLYWVQAEDWAGISTSSTVLAVAVAASLDELSLGTLALCGNLLGTTTPYRGVRKAPAGSRLDLAAGRIHLVAPERPLPDVGRSVRSPGWDDAVHQGVRAISTSVAEGLEGHAEVLLELSGGLDSRMLLAAVPRERLGQVRAFTLDRPGGAESRVAARLAKLTGIEHEVVDMGGLDNLDVDRATTLVATASRRRDHSGNPLAAAVLDWAEERLDQGPRLTGQNGEYCRGFYYAGQRDRTRTTSAAAARLARWRMFTNDAVDPSVFAPGFIAHARERTTRQIVSELVGLEMPWLNATDEFYLGQRMQRWVGLGFSVACMSRTLVAPFFQPPFLEWSAAARPAHKRHSRLFSLVMRELSPELAAVPLADRPAPSTLAESRLTAQVRQLVTTTAKAHAKIRQRLARSGKPPSGAARLAALQQQAWSRHPQQLEDVAALSFVDADAVERIAHGATTLDPASVAFLATLQGLCVETTGTATTTH